MMNQAFIATLLIVQAATTCNNEDNTEITPFSQSYAVDDEKTLKCINSYILPWAATIDVTTADVKCGSSGWIPKETVHGFSGTAQCVACVKDKVDCSEGTCTDGACQCKDSYKLSLANPRLCEQIKCGTLTLSNQQADSEGPYDVNTMVRVTCSEGFHVKGEDSMREQTVTCTNQGHFDKTIKPCVVCVDNDDCKDGTCNANAACECDETAGYKLSKTDNRQCEKVECKAEHCTNNGVCSVKGIEVSCECKTGTTGRTCADFTTDPCGESPCKNEGECSRDTSNPEDYTKHKCTCTTGFTGKNCQEKEKEEEKNEEDVKDKDDDSAACMPLLGNVVILLTIIVNIL